MKGREEKSVRRGDIAFVVVVVEGVRDLFVVEGRSERMFVSLLVWSVCSVYDESVRYSRVSAVKHSTRREGEWEKLG